MPQDFFSERGSLEREARRRRRRRIQRRRRLVALGAAPLVVVAGVAAAGVLNWDGRPGGERPAAASPTDPAASAATTSPVPATSPDASSPSAPGPSATASPPALRRPTRKDPLRVYFGGDSLAGMPGVMFDQRAHKSGLMKVRVDYQESSRLTSPDPVDWPEHMASRLDGHRYDVGVFLIGINDPGMPMIVDGESTWYPKRAWLQEYQDRSEQLMRLMLDRGIERVYWVGLPVMPKSSQTAQVKRLNEVFEAAAAEHPDVVYIDSFTPMATGSGGFNAALRTGDGVHFTNEGAARIANVVWQAIRGDWQAVDDRS